MRKIITSLLFCSIGAYFALGAITFYSIGSINKMDSGFFPLVLGTFLFLCGMLNLFKNDR